MKTRASGCREQTGYCTKISVSSFSQAVGLMTRSLRCCRQQRPELGVVLLQHASHPGCLAPCGCFQHLWFLSWACQEVAAPARVQEEAQKVDNHGPHVTHAALVLEALHQPHFSFPSGYSPLLSKDRIWVWSLQVLDSRVL